MEASDSELMIRLAGGDDLALNALMERWSDRVIAFLFRMTGQREAACDLAQETFVKLYQARGRYQPRGSFSTWLFAIASNLARNHARWKSRHPTVSMDAADGDGGASFPDFADSGRDPGENVIAREKAAAVNRAVLDLPLELREALTLFVHEEMSYAEIARLSGCTAKAAETRIYRARRILKDKLGELA